MVPGSLGARRAVALGPRGEPCAVPRSTSERGVPNSEGESTGACDFCQRETGGVAETETARHETPPPSPEGTTLVVTANMADDRATVRQLLALLPQPKPIPRTPRCVRTPLFGSSRSPEAAPSVSPRAPHSKELPSDRASARALQLAIARMSEARPAKHWELLPAELRAEHQLLDSCLKQLVKHLATRCVEWAEVLEVVRGRLCTLWSRAEQSLDNRSQLIGRRGAGPAAADPAAVDPAAAGTAHADAADAAEAGAADAGAAEVGVADAVAAEASEAMRADAAGAAGLRLRLAAAAEALLRRSATCRRRDDG